MFNHRLLTTRNGITVSIFFFHSCVKLIGILPLVLDVIIIIVIYQRFLLVMVCRVCVFMCLF